MENYHRYIKYEKSILPFKGNSKYMVNSTQTDRFEKLVGKSLPMQKVYKQIQQAAKVEIPVLLIGATGTGKDLVAQAIHRKSPRKEGPYIPVNLGAIPTDLVGSELFGHEKGAFTGAIAQYKGKFEQGDQGTVFLDEIDTIDEKVQVSLLRLIEQKRFHRLGGKRAVSVDVRLIAATNTDIDELVEETQFRDDLFYRLDVFRITMPPLCKRDGDLPLLIEEFIRRFNRSLNKKIKTVSPECRHVLESYNWPGNVRELKNVVQRAMLVCEGSEIQLEHLPPRFQSHENSRGSALPKVTFKIGTPLEEVERQMILHALAAAENNRTRAAELLGISRRAIYNKLKKHNLE